MEKFKNGATVGSNGRLMIVSLERGRDEMGNVFCEWQDEESGDIQYDWFNPNDLKLVTS